MSSTRLDECRAIHTFIDWLRKEEGWTGSWRHADDPDLILSSDGNDLGVEIVRMTVPDIAAASATADEVFKKLETELPPRLNKPASIRVDFDLNRIAHPRRLARGHGVISKITDAIVNYVGDPTDHESFGFLLDQGIEVFPSTGEGVSETSVIASRVVSKSHEDLVALFRERVAEKGTKSDRASWLLVVTGHQPGVLLRDHHLRAALGGTFQTAFARVFLVQRRDVFPLVQLLAGGG